MSKNKNAAKNTEAVAVVVPKGTRFVPTTTASGKQSKSITAGACLDGYVRGLGRTASGKPTLDVADQVADMLRGLTVEEVAKLTKTKLKALTGEDFDPIAKYGHLNPGQIRMNCGNRLRAAIRESAE